VPPDDEDGNAQGLVAMFRPDRSHVPVPRVGEIASSSEEESSGSEDGEPVAYDVASPATLGKLMQTASAFDAEDRAREERRRIRRLQSAPVPADREVGSSDEEEGSDEDEPRNKEDAEVRRLARSYIDGAAEEEDDRPASKKQKK